MSRSGRAQVHITFDGMDFTGMHARFLAHREALLARMSRVVEHGRFILGPEVEELEQKLAAWCNEVAGPTQATQAITCASGTDALRLALLALDIGPGHAVVLPVFGFAAAAEAVVLAGATPLFADIDPKTCNLDAADVTRRLRAWKQAANGSFHHAKPRAIIAIDTYGLPADYPALSEVAREGDLLLIEDAAQSLGASLHGRMAGSLADMAVTSFYPTKTLGCMGDGGAVFTARSEWAERLRSLRDHGQTAKYWHAEVGLNSRLDSLQAAVLLEMLPHLAEEAQERSRIATQYLMAFFQMAGEPNPAIACLTHPAGFASSWSCFTVLAHDREGLREHMQARGIPTACHYPRLLPESPAFARFAATGSLQEQYPHAYRISRQCLSLPLHGGLTLPEQEAVIEAVAAWSSAHAQVVSP